MSVPLQVVVPMAGEGSRFAKAGYTTPKPFIPVHGKPMIEWVIDNVRLPGFEISYIFIIRRTHDEKFGIKKRLEEVIPADRLTVVYAEALTDGAACTVLLAKEVLDPSKPILTVNSDQFLEMDLTGYANHLLDCLNRNLHSIMCFHIPMEKNDTKWSFAKVNEDGFVTETKEKVVISEHATVGFYFWAKAGDFLKAAEAMIAAKDKQNNEYYMCPVYNYNIAAGEKTVVFHCSNFWNLGIPEALDYFLANYKYEQNK